MPNLPTIEVDRSLLIEFFNACNGHVKYKLGKKLPLDFDPKHAHFPVRCDCSGYVRTLLHYATPDHIVIPDGSVNQHDWCDDQGFKPTTYKAVAGAQDSILRMAFIAPVTRKILGVKITKAGHVWLVINGRTIECCGGKGACRRPWNASVLLNRVSACYVLTAPLT